MEECTVHVGGVVSDSIDIQLYCMISGCFSQDYAKILFYTTIFKFPNKNIPSV